MRKAFSILLITALLLPNLTKLGILIDFTINQDFIATVLCINKDEPIKTCNGKCFLSEQLKKAEEQEEKQTPTNNSERLEIVFCYSTNSLDFLHFTDNTVPKPKATYKSEIYNSSFVVDIFHPPKYQLI